MRFAEFTIYWKSGKISRLHYANERTAINAVYFYLTKFEKSVKKIHVFMRGTKNAEEIDRNFFVSDLKEVIFMKKYLNP
jgi:hypothetical protein